MSLFALYKQKKKSLLVLIHIVCYLMVIADIPRHEDDFVAKFYDVNKGRLFSIIKSFDKQMLLEECTFACIQFLSCKSFNYNDKLNLCELCNDVYDENEAIENPSERWYNYATPSKQDGGFTPWSKWSDCPKRKECAELTHTRYRTCTNPSPDFGGANCHGDQLEKRTCKRNFPCSSKQTNYVICYSKENPKGYFEAKYTGVIKEVVLYHKNGSTRCHNDARMIHAYWGCVYDYDNCATDRCFSVHIFEEESGEILVPFKVTKSKYGSYNLHPYTEANPKKIILKVEQGYRVTRGKRYLVTLGYYKYYNYVLPEGHGIHCIDVEFIYSSI